jgi:hypothetical protein
MATMPWRGFKEEKMNRRISVLGCTAALALVVSSARAQYVPQEPQWQRYIPLNDFASVASQTRKAEPAVPTTPPIPSAAWSLVGPVAAWSAVDAAQPEPRVLQVVAPARSSIGDVSESTKSFEALSHEPTPPCPLPSVPGGLAIADSPPGRPTPQTPSTGQTPKTPEAVTDQPAPTQPDLGSEQAAAGGSESVALASPNMFGDQGAGRSALVSVPIRGGIVGGQYVNVGTTTPTIFTGIPSGNLLVYPTTTMARTVQSFGVVVTDPFVSSGPASLGQQTVPLAVNAQDQAGTLAQAQRQFGPGGTLTYLSNRSNATLAATPSSYNISTFYSYAVFALAEIPSPGAGGPGGTVGRTKVADDNSPLPRDRIIFQYDYFNNVPLLARGIDVNRFSPGFEKTFFDRRTSIEMRFPFAATTSTNFEIGGLGSNVTDWGDIAINLKGLVYKSDEFNASVGWQIALPTARDTNATVGGVPVVKIKNETVYQTPWVAFLWTPNDCLFMQNWYMIGFDPNANPVLANPDLVSGLRPVGRIADQSLLEIDAQVGYWVMKSEDPCAWFRRLGPFLELHYNSTVTNADLIQSGGFIITSPAGRYDELNLTAGAVAQIGDNLNMSLGAVVPLKNGDDRFFDWQVGFRASWFFGPTARERSRARDVSAF